jgi:nicotinamide-nucleotide adenylyltransferase
MSPATAAFVGRFQPFHNGHLEVALEALAAAPRVYVGITNPDVRSLQAHDSNSHRHRRGDNPFRYHERARMIAAALSDAGIAAEAYTVVPFPLENAALWANYIPLDSLQFVRVFSPWEAEKLTMLRAGGYNVRMLQGTPDNKISAGDIRQAMLDGADWRRDLSPPVAHLCGEIGIATLRRRMLQSGDSGG